MREQAISTGESSSRPRNQLRRRGGAPVTGYVIAVLAVAAALLLTLSLWEVTEPIRFLLLFSAVMLGAWHGGLGPGLFATALAAVASAYFILKPFYTLTVAPENVLRLAMFVVLSSLISYLSASRKRANERLMRQAEELGQSEQRFHAAFESASIGVALYSPDGRFTQVNRSLCEMVGYAEPELLSRELGDITHPDDSGADREQVRRVLAGEIRAYEIEKRFRHKDGRIVWVLVSASLVRDAEGRPLYFVAQIQDITASKRVREEREQLLARERAARAEAVAANRAKDEFLATVSHDLRTPLTSMLMWVRMLEAGKLDASASADAYANVLGNIDSLSRLINDLLDVTRITTGKLRVTRRDVRLGEIVEGAIETIRPAAAAKEVRIKTRLADGAQCVSADPDRLRQVFWNLLSNAVKFTPAGGIIHVGLEYDGDEARLTVTDTGRGISPEALPRLFDRFYQDEHHREHTGLGLGLSIAHAIVELHGGKIEAASAGIGCGATFTVRLPVSRRAAEAAAI